MLWRIPGYFGRIGTAARLNADKDSTLSANSDWRSATQKAIKAYVDTLRTYVDALLAAQDAMVFKGVIDCSANPNYPAADAGHVYKVSVAGKIGGASGVNVQAGDTLYCIFDGSSAGTEASVGANWTIVQVNIDGAVTGQASSVDSEIALFSGTGGKVIKRASVTGMLKAAAGVLAAAVAGTDYCAATSGSELLKGASGSTTPATPGTDFVKPNTSSSLSAGFYNANASQGTKSSGTFTPDPASMPNMISYTNGGAHTLAPWSATNKNATMIIDIINGGSSGAVTVSGWTKVDGDSIDTTSTSKFRCYASVGPNGSHLNVKKMA